MELVDELRGAPEPWMDTAIVVAFEDRFEFVREDDVDPLGRLDSLQRQGRLAIGLAGLKQENQRKPVFSTRVFKEYVGQGWAHRYMDLLGDMAQDGSRT
jgi:hypothetical protein